jgi:hypothetical protein
VLAQLTLAFDTAANVPLGPLMAARPSVSSSFFFYVVYITLLRDSIRKPGKTASGLSAEEL